MGNSCGTLVIFDLDGTITKRDTYVHFLCLGLSARPLKFFWLPLLGLIFIFNKLKLVKDSTLKQIFLFTIYRNSSRLCVDKIASALAQEVVSRGLREQAYQKISSHRSAGHRVVLATASLDIYAEKIALLLGIDEVIASRCKWNANGTLSGLLNGSNLKRVEKLNAVRRLAGKDFSNLYTIAYSDNHSDLPLLLAVNTGIAVNPTKSLRKLAATHGLSIENWD